MGTQYNIVADIKPSKKYEVLKKYKKDFMICKENYDYIVSYNEILNVYELLCDIAYGLYHLSGFKMGTIVTRIERAKPYLKESKDYLASCFYLVEGYLNMVEEEINYETVYSTLKTQIDNMAK